MHNSTSWNQSIHGAGNIVKTGEGRLILTSLSESTFEGTFTHTAGTLRLNGSLEMAPLTVTAGALLEGIDGTANSGLTVQAGGILSPGTQRVPEVPGIPGDPNAEPPIPDIPPVPEVPPTRATLTASALTLEAGAIVELGFDPYDEENPSVVIKDRIIVTGPANLGGAELHLELTYNPAPNEIFVLVENQSGQPVTGLLQYNSQPLEEGAVFMITSGEFSHEAQITYNYNGGGYSQSVALVPPGGIAPGGYDAWREARFGDPNDPAGAPDAQAPGQLVANLMFYALGLDLAADAAAGVPVATGEATITFLRRADLEADLVVEATNGNPGAAWDPIASLSTGASTWSGSAIVTEEPAGEGLVRVTVTDTGTTDTGVRLVRLRAVLP